MTWSSVLPLTSNSRRSTGSQRLPHTEVLLLCPHSCRCQDSKTHIPYNSSPEMTHPPQTTSPAFLLQPRAPSGTISLDMPLARASMPHPACLQLTTSCLV